ncbi:MAG: beta-lactamase family protein [Renibacterium sp.]|nr:beta-lactamase family protein [Renibacterium sp.]
MNNVGLPWLRRRWIPLLGSVSLIGILLAAAPLPQQLEVFSAGNKSFAATVKPQLPGGVGKVCAAVLNQDRQELACFGAQPDSRFEIGSLTKTFTAMLLADAVNRGEVALDTRLGELLDVGQSPASTITLQELATHTSGLPRLPNSPGFYTGAFWANLTAGNPYTQDRPSLLGYAREAALSDRGSFGYSNFGFALLGEALAARAGTDYSSLVRDRITTPLGMTNTSVAASSSTGTVPGYSTSFRAAEPWIMRAFSPAGAITSTVQDLAKYAKAILSGTAPGMNALEPISAIPGGDSIGLSWLTTERNGRSLSHHNGMTGGFASIMVLDREAGYAAVLIGNAAISLDEAGFALVADAAAELRK